MLRSGITLGICLRHLGRQAILNLGFAAIETERTVIYKEVTPIAGIATRHHIYHHIGPHLIGVKRIDKRQIDLRIYYTQIGARLTENIGQIAYHKRFGRQIGGLICQASRKLQNINIRCRIAVLKSDHARQLGSSHKPIGRNL